MFLPSAAKCKYSHCGSHQRDSTSERDDIVEIPLLCSDASPHFHMGEIWVTPGFCPCVFVHPCVRVRDSARSSQKPHAFLPLSASCFFFKRWNLHRPVSENPPQPQAGGLRQSRPTTAGDAARAGRRHLCQRGRHTVRSVGEQQLPQTFFFRRRRLGAGHARVRAPGLQRRQRETSDHAERRKVEL